MKILSAETHELRIPFENGSAAGWGHEIWNEFAFTLLEIRTEDGLVGWGEAWTYSKTDEIASVLKTKMIPRIIGQRVTDVPTFSHDLLQGLLEQDDDVETILAMAAVDIALWDIHAKAAGVPLHRLLGEAHHERLPVFASFFRFDDTKTTAKMCLRALDEGMCWLKLHEIRLDCVQAARRAAPEATLILDPNCQWKPKRAVEITRALQDLNLYWLEEPIKPPEDVDSLSLLKFAGIPLAVGEHAHTLAEFRRIIDVGTVEILQPGILKMGSIAEVQKVLALAGAKGVRAVPYTPFHGPGLLASLHLMATLPDPIPVEFFYYTKMEGLLYGDALTPRDGYLSVPQSPGLGHDPDPEVLRSFAI